MPPKKSTANLKLAKAIRATREGNGYSQEGLRDAPGWTAHTSAPSSAANSTSRSTRSSRSQPGSTRRPAPYARERRYDAGAVSGFQRDRKRDRTPILRSVCGPNPHEQQRTRANSAPRDSAFSRVFAPVRGCSRITNQSGRTVQIGFLKPIPCLLRSVCGLRDPPDPGPADKAS